VVSLVVATVLITASGALAPGPLTVSTIAIGVNGGWREGFKVAIGHAMFELPYIALLSTTYYSLESILRWKSLKVVLAVILTIVIIYFSIDLLRTSIVKSGELHVKSGVAFKNPILLGVTFTCLNPYFLLWWFTIGMPLITYSISLGLPLGLLIMYIAHVWMDLLWLSLIAHLSFKSLKLIGGLGYRITLSILAVILLIFATDIMLKTLFNLKLLPL